MDVEQIFRLIIRHSREVVPELSEHKFKQSDSLVDLGANSIDRAEIIMMIMESVSLNIPRVELYGAKNIGELASLVHIKLQ